MLRMKRLAGRRASRGESSKIDRHRASPRFHKVRRHVVEQKGTGRWWWRSEHYRGSLRLGKITKDYEVTT